MRKISFIMSLGILLCGLNSPLAAYDCASPYIPNTDTFMCDSSFRIGADYLYWKVEQENLSAGSFTTIDGTSVDAKVLNPDFNYQSGFKVNGGYELPGSEWGLGVEYSYIEANAGVSATTDANERIVSNNPSSAIAFLTDVDAKWNININQMDIDFARNIGFSEHFKIRPHAGFRTLWWHQTYTTRGTGLSSANPPVVVSLDQHFKERLNSYGIEGGLWADWNIGYGVALVGHAGGSVLYSTFKTIQIIDINNSTDGTLLGESIRKGTVRTGTPTFDYFIGLQYGDCFCNTYVAARLGWEQRIVLNASQYPGLQGNLSAAGLTAMLNVAF